MEPWRVYRPVVADSHHLDEEQDPDPHNKVRSWIRIRSKVMRIRNLVNDADNCNFQDTSVFKLESLFFSYSLLTFVPSLAGPNCISPSTH
jgi:hypothetical protein